jgi:hypothetical protein
MKKMLAFSSLAVALCLSASVQAASKLDGDVTGDMTIKTTDCTLLSNDVSVKISKTTQGAYACSEVSNSITVGACSTAGATKERTENCSWSDNPADSGNPLNMLPNDTSCGVDSSQPKTFTVKGRIAYIGNSSGGKVAPAAMSGSSAGSNCTAADVRKVSNWPSQ